MGTYLLKAEDETLSRWKADAAGHGLSFAEYLRQLLDSGVIAAAPATSQPGKRSYTPDPKGEKQEKKERWRK